MSEERSDKREREGVVLKALLVIGEDPAYKDLPPEVRQTCMEASELFTPSHVAPKCGRCGRTDEGGCMEIPCPLSARTSMTRLEEQLTDWYRAAAPYATPAALRDALSAASTTPQNMVKTADGRDLMSELDKIASFLDSEKCGPSARIVEQAKRALNAAWIACGVASMERGEWQAEREALVSAASATLRFPTWADLLVAEGVRPEVLQFAVLMERKLKANDHKGTWEHCDLPYLIRRLKQEVMELERVVFGSDRNPEKIGGEAADVANFAMMLADNLSALPAGVPNNRADGGKA